MLASIPNKRESGFSLIELMIALVLGLFIIGGVLAVFMSSSASFNSTAALSRVQENGRFALEILAEDLRNTGNRSNCWGDVVDVINTADSDYEADAYDLNNPIKGWTDAAGEFFVGDLTGYQANTDLVIVKHAADASGVVLSANIDSTDTTFPVTGGVVQGAILLLSDAAGCDLFQNTAATNSASVKRGSATGDAKIGNKAVSGQPLSHAYISTGSTDISQLSSALYYVGSGASSATALRSVHYDNGVANDEELVEGVTDLAFLYGVVSGASSAVDYTSDADAVSDWDDVVAVRVNVTVQNEDIIHNFSTTVALRNRLP